MNLYAIKLRQSLRDHVVVGLMQSPLIKVLRLDVFKKQTLRFALVGQSKLRVYEVILLFVTTV